MYYLLYGDFTIQIFYILYNFFCFCFQVTAIISRNKMKDYLPIKVKGKWLYYLLDADGKFLNPELFDHTIGMQKR